MADPEIVEVEAGEGGSPATPAPMQGGGKRRRLMIAGVALVLLLVAAGAAAFLMRKPAGGEGGSETAMKADYVDVPEMVVNLRSPDGAPHFLKVHLMLVPGERGSGDAVKNHIPPLLDAYQPFLRELRPEDLAGSAAVFRIKEELLRRSAAVLGDGMVKDILIQDLVQQ
ncbi:MAG: flagellar basal body-associated FliL family protein [Sphingomonas bacterium]